MNIRHPGQLKKLKFWGPFWSYQLNSTANSAQFAQFLGKWAKLAVLAPRILIFPTAMGAEYSFYVKSIATYAPQKVDIICNSFLDSVRPSLQLSTSRLTEWTSISTEAGRAHFTECTRLKPE